jgi:hypothetical protein
LVLVRVELIKQSLDLCVVGPLQQTLKLVPFNEACFVAVKVIESLLEGSLSPQFFPIYHRRSELAEADASRLVLVNFVENILDLLDVVLFRVILLIGLDQLVLFNQTVKVRIDFFENSVNPFSFLLTDLCED